MQKTALTIVITTYNEADNLKELLPMLEWADEIMVIDSFSTDNSFGISRKYTDFVIQRKYIGPANQKNWAIPQARYPWVLILDADERPTPNLVKEIQTILKNPSKDGYWIPRKNYFMGKRVKYSGWQGDAVIRLINRDKCRYNNRQVHEEIMTDGIQIGRLKHALVHNTFKNIEHYLDKTRRYAHWSAKDKHASTPKITFFHLAIKPFFRFCKHYFWQGGFLDGQVGFIISSIMAWGVFLRYVYMKEL